MEEGKNNNIFYSYILLCIRSWKKRERRRRGEGQMIAAAAADRTEAVPGKENCQNTRMHRKRVVVGTTKIPRRKGGRGGEMTLWLAGIIHGCVYTHCDHQTDMDIKRYIYIYIYIYHVV